MLFYLIPLIDVVHFNMVNLILKRVIFRRFTKACSIFTFPIILSMELDSSSMTWKVNNNLMRIWLGELSWKIIGYFEGRIWDVGTFCWIYYWGKWNRMGAMIEVHCVCCTHCCGRLCNGDGWLIICFVETFSFLGLDWVDGVIGHLLPKSAGILATNTILHCPTLDG